MHVPRLFPPLALLVLGALSPALAGPAPSLRGVTPCISALGTVWVMGELPAPLARNLETRLLTDLKTDLRAQGVKYTEQRTCDETRGRLRLEARVELPGTGAGGARETKVTAWLADPARTGEFVGGKYLWYSVHYDQVENLDGALLARLQADMKAALGKLVADWKADNR